MAAFKPVSRAALQAQLDHSVDPRMEDLKRTPIALGSREEYARAISQIWGEARAHFLAIGRYLVLAKERLAHGEFEAMVRGDLPFGTHVAYQLREVAEAIDQGRLEERELPPSYSVIYRIAKLSDPVLAAARKQGLIRPDVSRREIEAFVRARQTAEGTDARGALEERRQQVLRQLAKLRRELDAIDRELDAKIIEGQVAGSDSSEDGAAEG